MKFDVTEINKHVIGSDTDSLIMCLEPILRKKFPNYENMTDDEMVIEVKKLQQSIGDKLNQFQNNIALRCFNSTKHYLDLKPEYIIKNVYWAGKRRYAQYIVDKEGVKVDELDVKGLDIMKSNFPAYFRNFGEQLIKDVLFGKPKSEIDKDVMAFKKSISTVEWKKLLKPTGLKKLDAYIERKPMPGEIFSKLAKKCPVNTKGAIASNDILRFKKLTRQYPEFTIGDKIYLAMLKPNPYQLDVIALNGYNDAPELLELVNKYLDREGLFDSIIRNKLDGVYSDLGWTLNLNPHANKFFQFD